MKLEDFVDLDDKIMYNSEDYALYKRHAKHQHFVHHTFVNKSDSILEFHSILRDFQFNNKELVRPKFDTYFMRLAELAASRSNCMKRGNGAIITKD